MRPSRAPLVAAVLVVAACNSVAGLGDYTEGPPGSFGPGSSGASGASGASGTSGTSGTLPDGAVPTTDAAGLPADAQPFDSGVLVTSPDGGQKCQPCGTDCCISGGPTPQQCLQNNKCGACSPIDTSCTGDRDCCNGKYCAAGASPGTGACKDFCVPKFSTCFVAPCCVGSKCTDTSGFKQCM